MPSLVTHIEGMETQTGVTEMTNQDKAGEMKAALEKEAQTLAYAGQNRSANAIRDYLWNCDDHSLCRLYDLLEKARA